MQNIYKLLLFFILSITLMAKTQTIVFGAGCFWGVEKYYDNLEGVINARSGYAGGNYDNPSYSQVRKLRNIKKGVLNHTEVVEVVYDDSKISTERLIKSFWELHNPTQVKGNNYRSALYYTNDAQKRIANNTQKTYQTLLTQAGYGRINTEVKPLEKFYLAEEHHQDYLIKKPKKYCPNYATGVTFDNKKKITNFITPLGGKEIVVIDAEHCRFCEKFKANVTDHYKGSIPLRTVHQDELKGFKLYSKIEGTPTVLFFIDGEEIYSHVGYMDEKKFYKALGKFKLGKKSKAYKVAFKKRTDRRFCKQYDAFKQTGDGVFIDKVSGDILFDTRDRFNSGSGWLSFYKAVDGATVRKVDYALGMKSTEILAKRSKAHLGHVFNDAPGGKERFCINATILEFVPRNEIIKNKVQK